MKKSILLIIGVISALLLLLSFPVREAAGTQVCDIMRIAGFALIIIYFILRIVWRKRLT